MIFVIILFFAVIIVIYGFGFVGCELGSLCGMTGYAGVIGIILSILRSCGGGGFAVTVFRLGFVSIILVLSSQHSTTDTSYSPH